MFIQLFYLTFGVQHYCLFVCIFILKVLCKTFYYFVSLCVDHSVLQKSFVSVKWWSLLSFEDTE